MLRPAGADSVPALVTTGTFMPGSGGEVEEGGTAARSGCFWEVAEQGGSCWGAS